MTRSYSGSRGLAGIQAYTGSVLRRLSAKRGAVGALGAFLGSVLASLGVVPLPLVNFTMKPRVFAFMMQSKTLNFTMRSKVINFNMKAKP